MGRQFRIGIEIHFNGSLTGDAAAYFFSFFQLFPVSV
jgi:hypothetical protein